MEEQIDGLLTTSDSALASRIVRAGRPLKVHRIKAGHILVREGESGKAMFLLLDGHISVSVSGKVLAELGPGSVVGERAVVDAGLQTSSVPITVLVLQGPAFAVATREELQAGYRTATLTAITDSRVAELAPEDIDPEILRQLAEHHHREGSR